MSEIEKLYKIAGVEKQYYYFDSADGNTYTWELNENGNDKHNMCFIGKPKIKDREFTAEKQLRLTTFIGLHYGFQMLKNESFDYIIATRIYVKYDYEYKGYGYGYDEAIANLINNIWQDLTESEQEQIRSVLKG